MPGKNTAGFRLEVTVDQRGGVQAELFFDRIGKKAKVAGRQVEQASERQQKASKEAVTGMEKWAKWVTYLASLYGFRILMTTLEHLTEKARQFRAEAAKVANLGAPIARIREELKRLDPVYANQTTLMRNYFRIHSGGITEVNAALGVTRDAARAAFAEQADLVDVTKAGIKIYNIFGSQLRDTTQAFEILSETARFGDTDLQAVASSIAEILPIAEKLGFNLFDVTGTFALLTRVSGSTAEAATNLSSMMRSLMNDTKEAQDAAAKLNIVWDANIAQALGLRGTLAYLKEALDRSTLSAGDKAIVLRSLTGRIQGLNALLALMGDQYENIDEAIRATTDSYGALLPKLLRMEEAIGAHTRLANAWENIQIQLGEDLLPSLDMFSRLLMMLTGVLPQVIKFATDFGVALVALYGLRKLNVYLIETRRRSLEAALAFDQTGRAAKGASLAIQALKAAIGLFIVMEVINFLFRLYDAFVHVQDATAELIHKEKAHNDQLEENIDEYIRLKQASSLTAEEQERFAKLQQDLLNTFPDLRAEIQGASQDYDVLAARMRVAAKEMLLMALQRAKADLTAQRLIIGGQLSALKRGGLNLGPLQVQSPFAGIDMAIKETQFAGLNSALDATKKAIADVNAEIEALRAQAAKPMDWEKLADFPNWSAASTNSRRNSQMRCWAASHPTWHAG